MVEITPSAAEQIRNALREQADDDLSLRVAARRRADGDTEYGMGFDERREQDEQIVTASGIALLVSPASREAVAGMVIDFVEVAPGERRFIFYRAGSLPQAGSAPDAA
jgi:iron-sulfur cluster assembly protein